MTSRKGVPRVVWRRQSELGIYDSIPFLCVSRSLGNFWSLSPSTNCFTVSPKPDVHVYPLNPREQKFVVIASDGLWNVMSPDEVVQFTWDYEHDKQEQPRDVVKAIINEALKRWERKHLPADNIAVLIAFLSESKEESRDENPPRSLTQSSTPNEDASIAQEISPSSKADVMDSPPTSIPSETRRCLEEENNDLDQSIVKARVDRIVPLNLQRNPLTSCSMLSPGGKHSRGEEVEGLPPLAKRSKLLECDSGCDVCDYVIDPTDLSEDSGRSR